MRNKKKTRDYLIGMGCDIKLSDFLSRKYELDKLKGLSVEELKDLGLRNAVAQDIKSGRPPIPSMILDSVLQKNLRICCVCYNETRSVILHHIKSYAEEKKHEESNLAVLCIQCHGKAHTVHALEQDLDQIRLLSHKKSWEAAVAHRKTWIIASSTKSWNSETRWDWINLTRLQTTIQSAIADHAELPSSEQRQELENTGFLMGNGFEFNNLAKDNKEGNYFTNIGEKQIFLTAYLTQLIEWLADQIPVFDATDYCENPSLLENILKTGVYFCVEVEFSVNNFNPNLTIGIGRNKKLKVEFAFDNFLCTTSTSRIIYNRDKHTKLVAFGSVRSTEVDPHNGDITISMSPLGLAQKFSPNDYFEPGFFSQIQ